MYEVFSGCPGIVPLPLLPHQEVAEGLFQARFFQKGAVCKDVGNGSVCQDGTVFHYDAARAQIHDHVQIMGSNDFGMGELAQQADEGTAGGRVQVSARFVQHQDVRTHGEDRGDGDGPFFPSRKMVGHFVCQGFRMDFPQGLFHAAADFLRGEPETPERKPYLDSVADGKNLDEGDIDLLPDALRSSYGKYESAWEEAMSMRSSGLCHPDDIREQTDIMNGNYKEFREGLREFLGLDKANDASFVREQPTYPNKDWNEQLLAEQKQEETVDETQAREQSPEEEQQTHFRR